MGKFDELIAQSAKTDVQVLLSAKEKAKKLALEDPTSANLSALNSASQMLEKAMSATKTLKNYEAVLEYAKQENRKLGQTKLYADIKAGRLKKQADGSFKMSDVSRYMSSLSPLATTDAVASGAAARQKRKEEAEIKRVETIAEREAFDLAVKKGKFIPREQVHLELAARAVTLSSGIRTAFEARILDIVSACDGNPKKSTVLFELMESILDESLNEYSREMEYDVTFIGDTKQGDAD